MNAGAGRKGMPTAHIFDWGGGGGWAPPAPPPPPAPRFLRLCVKFYTVWHSIFCVTQSMRIQLMVWLNLKVRWNPNACWLLLICIDVYTHISLDFGIYICVKYLLFFSYFFSNLLCSTPWKTVQTQILAMTSSVNHQSASIFETKDIGMRLRFTY